MLTRLIARGGEPLLEPLCLDPAFADWSGIGFMVQAYGKRAPFVLDWTIDLARRTGHRLMVRLVEGAYWDSEIKRAQVEGLEDYPVFTRKLHTDVSYLACAQKLLGAGDAVFAQFASHNPYTVAAIHHMAGDAASPGAWEFHFLHGMGEPQYGEVIGLRALGRPCRIYATVGVHETLLAYLVRRLLENGANTSFVNRVQDRTVVIERWSRIRWRQRPRATRLALRTSASSGRCAPGGRCARPWGGVHRLDRGGRFDPAATLGSAEPLRHLGAADRRDRRAESPSRGQLRTDGAGRG